MAKQWQPGDVPALHELAYLRQQLMAGKTSLTGEVRLRSGDFGLTIAGRRALRWVLDDDESVRRVDYGADEVAQRRQGRRQRLDGG